MNSPIVLLAVLTYLATITLAQVPCSGVLNSPNPLTDDVTVTGGSCTIQGITITGSVSVSSGGTLRTEGATVIQGSVSATGSGDVTLAGSTQVSGAVSFGDTTSRLTLGNNAVVTSVSVSNGARFLGRGSTGGLGALNSGVITLRGGTVTGGGINVEGGTGVVRLCGANLAGGVSLVERSGNLVAVPGSNCAASTIAGSIAVEKGTGNVRVTGATVTGGDLGVVEQTGDVSIRDTALSDVSIDKITGDVLLRNVNLDSDASIVETDGTVTLRDSNVLGDFGVEGTTGTVDILNNDFNNEGISVSGSQGFVTVTGNSNLSAGLEENAGVNFSNNNGLNAQISKNTVSTTVNSNVLATLSCVDNTPPPTGSGNTVTTPDTEQCAGF